MSVHPRPLTAPDHAGRGMVRRSRQRHGRAYEPRGLAITWVVTLGARVKVILKVDDEAGGNYIVGWYDAMRILKGDAFWADVRP